MTPQTTRIRRLVSDGKTVLTFHVPEWVYNKSTALEYMDTILPSWVPAGYYHLHRGVLDTKGELIWRNSHRGFYIDDDDDDPDDVGQPTLPLIASK